MHEFYKLHQQNGDHVASFVTLLEGALSDIQTKHPRKITEREAQEHLHGLMFHGFLKLFVTFCIYMFD